LLIANRLKYHLTGASAPIWDKKESQRLNFFMNTIINTEPQQATRNSWQYQQITPRIAIIKNPKGECHTSYFGFDTLSQVKRFLSWLSVHQPSTCAITRKAQRLATKWEVKVWQIDESLLLKLIKQSKTKS
jgi:hypothetical protein